MSKGRIKKQFPGQTGLYQGKVRVVRTVGSVLVVETTDNISAFDIVLPVEIPKKGVILAIISRYFMKATEDIIPNCLIDAPGLHPRMALWRKTTPFKFEVVVRAYMEGSMWREQYSIGRRDLWGYHLPEGIKYQQKLPYLMFTPSTKAPDGEHDEPISRDQILERGLATAEEYDYIYAKAFELFKRGEEMATTQGLILVDTKYEFGKDENGKIYLIDEVHTPDSSRYYYLEGYDKKFQREEPQKQLSKEFVRQWLLDQGYSGKKDQKMPDLNKGFIETVQRRYEELYDAIVEPRPRIYFKAYNDVPDSDGDVLYEQVSAALVKIRPQIEGPTVGVIMGSNSDLPMMEKGLEILTLAGVPFECGAVSAHRTPMDIEQYAATARERGIKVIIAAAGGAAHLPGMVAASTTLPVIGVPIKSANSIMGVDSLLSIVQMPAGVPVGTMATDGAENAGLYALQILATHDERIAAYLVKHKENLIAKVSQMRKDTASKYFFGL